MSLGHRETPVEQPGVHASPYFPRGAGLRLVWGGGSCTLPQAWGGFSPPSALPTWVVLSKKVISPSIVPVPRTKHVDHVQYFLLC